MGIRTDESWTDDLGRSNKARSKTAVRDCLCFLVLLLLAISPCQSDTLTGNVDGSSSQLVIVLPENLGIGNKRECPTSQHIATMPIIAKVSTA